MWTILPSSQAQHDNDGLMVSFGGGGGGGAALSSPAGILVLVAIIAVVALVYWLFNR